MTSAGDTLPAAGPIDPALVPAASPANDQPSKWHQYYATDPYSAPWDTHAVSSQLRTHIAGAASARSCCSAASQQQPAAAGVGPASQPESGDAGDAESAPPPPLWGRAGAPSPRALELCCGTGASLAYLLSQGFSVVGVELVAAACRIAAQRLADAAVRSVAVQVIGDESDVPYIAAPSVAARQEAPSSSGPATQPATQAPTEPATRPPIESTYAAATHAVVLQGDLFRASLPPGSFDFVYDCQGLHAMPPPLRPAYVAVLRSALRSGGQALVLVGRLEEDGEKEEQMDGEAARLAGGDHGVAVMGSSIPAGPSATAQAGVSASHVDAEAPPRTPPQSADPAGGPAGPEGTSGSGASSGCTGAGAAAAAITAASAASSAAHATGAGNEEPGSGRASAAAPAPGSARGPSLMSREELLALFPEPDWRLCDCTASRFDLTPAYARLPRTPPAWCLVVERS